MVMGPYSADAKIAGFKSTFQDLKVHFAQGVDIQTLVTVDQGFKDQREYIDIRTQGIVDKLGMSYYPLQGVGAQHWMLTQMN